MQPHTLEPIASAADVFSAAHRQLQIAVDAANHLGLVVPDSFPDAIDHLQGWAASVEAEARGLQVTDLPTPPSLLVGRAMPDARNLPMSRPERPRDGRGRRASLPYRYLKAWHPSSLGVLERAVRLHGRAGRQGAPRAASSRPAPPEASTEDAALGSSNVLAGKEPAPSRRVDLIPATTLPRPLARQPA